ncbi:MAG: hypothetical protein K2H16_07245 [Prevotella sp.]|nr:hypothetical protein [Prevotella sp.]
MIKMNDLYFRFHCGGLAESLATEIHGTKEEIINYIQKDFADWGGISDLQCEFYRHDSRVKRYYDTYIVTGIYADGKRSPIGFASGSLF